MKVSVIIPTYNEERYIETCLQSLIQQEDPADEIIVVDNNSTDQTVEIASRYPVRILHEHKQGITPTRNRGYDAAKYDIIARTDADTIPRKDWIRKIKDFFESHPEYDAVSGTLYYDSLPELIAGPIFHQFVGAIQVILGHYPLIGPNMALRKSCWDKVGKGVCLDDHEVHEDIDISIHIDQHNGIIGYDPDIQVRSSTRRILGNPTSFFIEYPNRIRHMLSLHGIQVRELRGIKKPHMIDLAQLPSYIKKYFPVEKRSVRHKGE